MARCLNPPDAASRNINAATVRIATCGVRNRGWTRASARGSAPSSAARKNARGVDNIPPASEPKIDTATPIITSVLPPTPTIRPATAASGAVVWCASSLPRTPWLTSCNATYSRITVPVAPNMARGTVRAGSRISALGASASSMPWKAKNRISEASPNFAAGGHPAHRS